MNLTSLIKQPLITEKSLQAASKNCFTFKVDAQATKHQIKQAVEQVFKVTVVGVRTSLITKTIIKRGRPKLQKSWKKAIVELKSGDKIDLFDIKKD